MMHNALGTLPYIVHIKYKPVKLYPLTSELTRVIPLPARPASSGHVIRLLTRLLRVTG